MNRTALFALLHSLNLPNFDGDYCMIGSAALMLSQPTADNCDDVDILTDTQNADRLASRWHEHLTETMHANGHDFFRSRYYRFEFPLGVVEVMGDLEIEQGGRWHRVCVDEIITCEGFMIPSIREQKRLLALFGRPKDIIKLNAF